jgi:hypothetical protein
MKISTLRWTLRDGWSPATPEWLVAADLVLFFGAREILGRPDGAWKDLPRRFPGAVCVGCSTAGEIAGSSVSDGSIAALCIAFAKTRVRAETISVHSAADSHAAATTLGARLAAPDLSHVLVFSDGLIVNGSALVAGLASSLPPGVTVTGGMAGDGADFQRTLVSLGGESSSGSVVAIGFYGSSLHVSHGSAGGWEPFGPRRLVTASEGNVLFKLDDQPALALYKRYLGNRAAGLPATGLLFPLHLLDSRDAEEGVVRTILAIDEARQSLTFAGDIPEGRYVRLMKASCDALVAGAESAARHTGISTDGEERFAVLVSCVGRRLVLGQRVEEEVEAVLAQLGPRVHAAGFYSYGEICPSEAVCCCDLHNQTMTLTVFAESA